MSIEIGFGFLKRRFPALKTEIRLSKPTDICAMIHSAFILHNMCRRHNDNPDFEDINLDDDYDQPEDPPAAPLLPLPDVQNAQSIRDELCDLVNN